MLEIMITISDTKTSSFLVSFSSNLHGVGYVRAQEKLGDVCELSKLGGKEASRAATANIKSQRGLEFTYLQ
jgi:hypothetical protein